ncbi:hypothetical protein JCM3766R1_000035 [Sporobolomyces carnicolor]
MMTMNQPVPTLVEPSASSTSTATGTQVAGTTTAAADKFESPESDASRASKQAREWNSLLAWNRTARLAEGGSVDSGWDYATSMYHVPRQSPEYYANVTRDPDATRTSARYHATTTTTTSNVTQTAGGDKDFELSGDESRGYHDSGRPKRSRQAMTRG